MYFESAFFLLGQNLRRSQIVCQNNLRALSRPMSRKGSNTKLSTATSGWTRLGPLLCVWDIFYMVSHGEVDVFLLSRFAGDAGIILLIGGLVWLDSSLDIARPAY